MSSFPELQQWHKQTISKGIIHDPQVRKTKKEVFGNDLHGGAAYIMFLELQSMDEYDISTRAFNGVTACVLGTWLDGHDIPEDFPIDLIHVMKLYDIYRKLNSDNLINVEGRVLPEENFTVDLITRRDRVISEEDIPMEALNPGVRFPLGVLFDHVRNMYNIPSEVTEDFLAGFDLGVSRWRELSTAA